MPSATPSPTSPLAPTSLALCLHSGAAGIDDHVDLFIGPPDAAARTPDDRVARAWRLPRGAWDPHARRLVAGTFEARELPHHRARYLDLASPVALDQGRGLVEPLLRAHDATARVDVDRIEIATPRLGIVLVRTSPGAWTARVAVHG